MTDPAAWLRWHGDALRLDLRVQPRASRDEACGESGGRLRVRLTAPAVENRANERLIRWLAGEFGVAPGRVRLLRGERGRNKTVEIDAPARRPAWFAEFAGNDATRPAPPRRGTA